MNKKSIVTGNNIKYILEEKNMTQQELCDLVGIRAGHLSKIINMKSKNVSLPVAHRISKCLNTPIENVFNFNYVTL